MSAVRWLARRQPFTGTFYSRLAEAFLASFGPIFVGSLAGIQTAVGLRDWSAVRSLTVALLAAAGTALGKAVLVLAKSLRDPKTRATMLRPRRG